LLLAAGQQPGQLGASLAEDREAVIGHLAIGGGAQADRQVVLDR
jgi:hypothetical protein